ncbi:MAG: hypothetical protein KAT26_03025 [Marinosulfonomonas sp.]|nr:hypothetical protein [Marinosulfonomonas sp.]
MSIHSIFEGAQFVAQASDIVKKNGIYLRIGTCFSEYGKLISMQRPQQPVGQPFDCRKNNFQPESGFWIAGWNEDDVLVHTQAVRLVDLAGLSLAGYMGKKYIDFPPAGLDLDMEKSRYNPGPAARKIRGKVCYHGDFWLSGDYRGTGVVSVLARFALASALLKWSPDFVIGLMIRPIAFKGLAEREGYMHSEPGCLYWHRADNDAVLEIFMVWMGREDISHLLTIPLQGLAR